jgi:hypothetical protein
MKDFLRARARKSRKTLCKTCSKITLQQLATARGVIIPHRWAQFQESANSCSLCAAISKIIRIQDSEKPQLVIRAITGGVSSPGNPLRFLVLGLSEGCPKECNGKVEIDPHFKNCKGTCEVDYREATRIMTLEGMIDNHAQFRPD